MGSQASVNTNDKEQQLKKASKMSLIRSLLPIAGLVIIFLLFNVLTNFRMMKNLPLVLSQVYVTMIAATGVFFIMTMGGLDFSQGSILGIASIVVCMLSKTSIPLAIVGGIVADLIAGDPQKRTKTKLICAFAAFTFCFWLGQISLILMMGEAYAEMCVQAGMTLEYGQTLVNSILSPMGVVTGAATIVGGLVGGFIGTKVFSKHFAKLGM